MQALTIAISPSGIQYLTHELIVGKFVSALSGLVPPDVTLPIGNVMLPPPGRGASELAARHLESMT
jgi:hypothetical protein